MRTRNAMTPSKMFQNYDADGLFDEMFMARGVPRPHYAPVAEQLMQLDLPAFERRRRMADVSFRNQGITFTVYGDQRGVEKIFPFDLVPRIIPSDEWDLIERSTALNLFCQDIYHKQRILKEGIIPPELIYGAKMFRREMFGVKVP